MTIRGAIAPFHRDNDIFESDVEKAMQSPPLSQYTKYKCCKIFVRTGDLSLKAWQAYKIHGIDIINSQKRKLMVIMPNHLNQLTQTVFDKQTSILISPKHPAKALLQKVTVKNGQQSRVILKFRPEFLG